MTRDDAPKGMPGVTLTPLSKLEGPATGYENSHVENNCARRDADRAPYTSRDRKHLRP
jgi:hypothetical protein